MRELVSWLLRHKIVSVCLLFSLFIAVELGTLPFKEVAALRTINPRWTALMEERREQAASASIHGRRKSFTVRQYWVPLDRISPNLVHAVVTAEDGTFYQHWGVDWFEVKESIERDLQEGRPVRGASTITQQLAKNLFLSTAKDPIRKIREILIALLIEWQLSKRRILELYLNVVEWGDGIYGAEAASRSYFGVSAALLSREQAARLAAVLPSPLRHKPNKDQHYVVRRSSLILRRMEVRGY